MSLIVFFLDHPIALLLAIAALVAAFVAWRFLRGGRGSFKDVRELRDRALARVERSESDERELNPPPMFRGIDDPEGERSEVPRAPFDRVVKRGIDAGAPKGNRFGPNARGFNAAEVMEAFEHDAPFVHDHLQAFCAQQRGGEMLRRFTEDFTLTIPPDPEGDDGTEMKIVRLLVVTDDQFAQIPEDVRYDMMSQRWKNQMGRIATATVAIVPSETQPAPARKGPPRAPREEAPTADAAPAKPTRKVPPRAPREEAPSTDAKPPAAPTSGDVPSILGDEPQ